VRQVSSAYSLGVEDRLDTKERRNRVAAVVGALASHQCVPGSIPAPGVICGFCLLLVLYSPPRGFSPGTPVFPSPQKPALISKIQFDLIYYEPLDLLIAQALPVFDVKFTLTFSRQFAGRQLL